MLLAITLLLGFLQAVEPCSEGAAAYKRGDFEGAESYLKECLERHPEEIGPYLTLCAFYQDRGDEQGLYETASRGLRSFPEEKRFYLTVGVRAGSRGDYSRAVEVLAEGRKRWPDDPQIARSLFQAYLARGMQHLDQAENRKAEMDLREALEIDPESVDTRLNLGRALHNLEFSGLALEQFDRVKAMAPDTPLVDFHRGVALSGLGRFDEVIATMNRQLLTRPDYAACHYFRGLAFLRKGEWDRARADLTLSVAAMPDFIDGVYRLGQCYLHFGQLVEAEAAFRRCLSLRTDDVRSLYALGRVLQMAGRVDEAREMFQKAENQYVSEELESSGIKFGSTANEP